MRIIGIDASLTGTGISDGHSTWLIGSPAAGMSLSARRARIKTTAERILTTADPRGADLVVIELPAFGGASGRGSMVLERSGLYWRLIESIIEGYGVPVVEVVTSQLKLYATGKGNAGKGLMIDAAARRLPDVVTGADDNRVDALWLAAMGYDHAGQPLCALPTLQRKVLERVTWEA
jgi:crossover junction endodeoxyribonuclease RuvC